MFGVVVGPDIEIIADDSLNEISKIKLNKFLHKWLSTYINDVLGDLIKLSEHKIDNQYLRGLIFQLYENNGVIKRNEVEKIVKSIPLVERKKLWDLGGNNLLRVLGASSMGWVCIELFWY